MAGATVLTFLDSHCEVNVEWLQPMLQRVMEVSPLSVEAGPLQEMPSVLAAFLSAELGWHCGWPQGLLPLRDPTHPAVSPET